MSPVTSALGEPARPHCSLKTPPVLVAMAEALVVYYKTKTAFYITSVDLDSAKKTISLKEEDQTRSEHDC